MVATPSVGWHAPRRQDFVLKAWPDGVVVYDESNGDVHALHPVAGEVLRCVLERGDAGLDDFLRSLADDEPSAQDVALLNNLLSELEALGFVERLLA